MFFKVSWKISLFLFLICFGFFISFSARAAEEIIINEIAWMGTASSSHEEWLEFFNSSTSSLDISSWSIYGADSGECLDFSQADGSIQTSFAPGEYLLYGNEENIFSEVDIDIWDATLGLNNSNPGDLKLFNKKNCEEGPGVIIDEVNNTEKWLAGEAENYKTMERKNINTWETSLFSGGTPGEENSVKDLEKQEEYGQDVEDESQEETPPNHSSGASFSPEKSYQKKSVLINELVSDPEEGEKEWVELKNNSDQAIDLSGWVLEEGSGSQTKLEDVLKPFSLLVFNKLKGNLNNSGDTLILKSPQGKIIDQVFYGEEKGSVPAPDSPLSLALDQKKEWRLTRQKTPGQENVIIQPSSRKKRKKTSALEIRITEILPNPRGRDRQKEFIELYNPTSQKINLWDWKISSQGGREYVLGRYDQKKYPLGIAPGKRLVIFRKRSFLPLNNNGDTIKLFSPNQDSPQQVLNYSQAEPGLSYNQTHSLVASSSATSTKIFLSHSRNTGEWVWSRIQTPGQVNQIKEVNKPPRVYFSYPTHIEAREDIFFDSSDTFDENGDELIYNWDFGDGVELEKAFPHHAFLKPGEYKVKLAVSDGQTTSSREKIIKVGDWNDKDKKSEQNFSNKPIENSEKKPFYNYSPEPKKENNNYEESDVYFNESGWFSPSQAKQLPEGEIAKVRGKVAVLPGVLASQYFYIVGSPGIQIYNYFKDFPKLSLGDMVEVNGEISLSRGEKRLKTESDQNIEIIGGDKPPKPKEYICAEVDKEKIGSLIEAEGEVTEIKKPKIYLDDDSGEVLVYIQKETGIKISSLKEGMEIRVAGIVNNYNNQLRLMPRFPKDVEIISEEQKEEKKEDLGEKNSTSSLLLPAQEKSGNKKIYIYLILILAGLLAFFYFFRKGLDF